MTALHAELRYRRAQAQYIRAWLYWINLPAWPRWIARRHRRIFLALLLIGATGLVAHYWTALPLLFVFARSLPASYQARHRRLACGNHRIMRGKARR